MNAFRIFSDGAARHAKASEPHAPQGGEVLLRLAACGAGHSALHLMEWAKSGALPFEYPFTLGHENTGWVEALGPLATGVAIGDAVAVYGAWGCGTCRSCRQLAENYCERARGMRGCGIGSDGGMTSHMLVPAARYLVPLGDLDPIEAAPLSDAGLTPYGAIARSLSLMTPDATVAVIGIGGLGHMALQILRAVTASQIVAIDLSEAKLEHARQLGAHATVRADADAVKAIRAAAGGLRVDVVLDFVGAQATADLGLRIVRPNGDLAIVGRGGGTPALPEIVTPSGARVSRPLYGTIRELEETVALSRAGKLRAQVERFTLADAPAAYERMRAGTLEGRAVICP